MSEDQFIHLKSTILLLRFPAQAGVSVRGAVPGPLQRGAGLPPLLRRARGRHPAVRPRPRPHPHPGPLPGPVQVQGRVLKDDVMVVMVSLQEEE